LAFGPQGARRKARSARKKYVKAQDRCHLETFGK